MSSITINESVRTSKVEMHSPKENLSTTNLEVESPEEDLSTNSNNFEVDPASDPFAPRPGRTLTWSNVSLSVKDLKGMEKTILESVSGRMGPQQLTAIMGHSGAGKTSLLNVLAGKIAPSQTMTVSRKMTLDGVKIDPSSINVKRKIAFVAQRDTLLATPTPREAIRFSAKLRLNKDMDDDEIEALVDRILKELRLDHVADSITGGEAFRGLSGGEMRRLSLGIELVVRPSILFCDEVTSGLDSHNAATVIEVLKRLAQCGASVLMSIHQPNSKVFNLIDHLILMNRGRCMYQGSVENIPQYFAMRGHEVPMNYNPADWILEVSQLNSTEELSAAGFFSEEDDNEDSNSLGENRRLSTISAISASVRRISSDSIRRMSSIRTSNTPRLSIFDNLEAANQVSLWTEVKVQVIRDVQKLMRDKRAMTLRLMIVIAGSIIIGIAFWGVGSDSLENDSTFMSHVGAMYFLIMANMIALQLIMLDQIEARPIFVREFETDHFGMLSYGLAKIATEALVSLFQNVSLLLIVYWMIDLQGRLWYWLLAIYAFTMIMTSTGVALASYTKDARDAKELIPMTLLPQILFCGFFVGTESLPSFLQWLQWVFPLTYTFRLILNEEFSFCLAQEEEYQAAEMCFTSMLNALTNARGKFETIYQNTSLVSLVQTGQYMGTNDIQEYAELFSTEAYDTNALVVDYCGLENSRTFKFNGISEDGVCDITLTDVNQGQINPLFVKEELKDHTYTQYVYGNQLRFTSSEDLQSVNMITHNPYLSQDFTVGGFNAFDKAGYVRDICTTLHDLCPESWALDGYQDVEDCVTQMESLPITNLNSKGVEASDGNSTSCRFIHANLAKENQDHCPHISFYPEEDMNGKMKCSGIGYDLAFADLFSPSDMEMFAKASVQFDLGEKQSIFGLTKNETRPCRAEIVDPREELAMSLPDDYATTKTCATYLEMQDATGENNGAYWAILAGMFVVVRVLGLWLLRNLVTKNKMA